MWNWGDESSWLFSSCFSEFFKLSFISNDSYCVPKDRVLVLCCVSFVIGFSCSCEYLNVCFCGCFSRTSCCCLWNGVYALLYDKVDDHLSRKGCKIFFDWIVYCVVDSIFPCGKMLIALLKNHSFVSRSLKCWNSCLLRKL